MKYRIIVLLLIVSVLLVACNEKNDNGSSLYFNSQVHRNVAEGCGGDRSVPHSLAELEKMTKYEFKSTELKSTAVIFECTVAGSSINRIPPAEEQRKDDVTYAMEHVITPVTITDIIYAGEEVDLAVGETYYMMEPFFYITEETPDYLEYYGPNTIFAREYSPMQRGSRHLVFGKYEHNEAFDYQGERILSAVTYEGVMCIASETKAKSLSINGNENYWKIWKEAMAKYG